MGQRLKGKFIAKHETEQDWNQSNYVPDVGEQVVYDPDDNYPYFRSKYGDGTKKVKDLPFANPQPDWNQTNEKQADFIKNKPDLEEYASKTDQSIVSIDSTLPYFITPDENGVSPINIADGGIKATANKPCTVSVYDSDIKYNYITGIIADYFKTYPTRGSIEEGVVHYNKSTYIAASSNTYSIGADLDGKTITVRALVKVSTGGDMSKLCQIRITRNGADVGSARSNSVTEVDEYVECITTFVAKEGDFPYFTAGYSSTGAPAVDIKEFYIFEGAPTTYEFTGDNTHYITPGKSKYTSIVSDTDEVTAAKNTKTKNIVAIILPPG